MSIQDLIRQVAECNNDAAAELLKRFKPLLTKYAIKLQYEDAYSDLSLAFLILIRQIAHNPTLREEGAIVSYIQVSIKRTYYKLKKKAEEYQNRHFNLDTDPDVYARMLEINHAGSDDYAFIEIEDAFSTLSRMERQIIYGIFKDGHTAADLAQQYGCSRQAITQTKQRALKKLREQFL